MCKCVARARPVGAQCARSRSKGARAALLFLVGTRIFPRDKTGLTMGKPEVNLTFFLKKNKVFLETAIFFLKRVLRKLGLITSFGNKCEINFGFTHG